MTLNINVVKSMELSQQVVSLELTKKLKELGVKQDAYWSWILSPHDSKYRLMDVANPKGYENLMVAGYELYSAFTTGASSG
jgi:hypothetical protein